MVFAAWNVQNARRGGMKGGYVAFPDVTDLFYNPSAISSYKDLVQATSPSSDEATPFVATKSIGDLFTIGMTWGKAPRFCLNSSKDGAVFESGYLVGLRETLKYKHGPHLLLGLDTKPVDIGVEFFLDTYRQGKSFSYNDTMRVATDEWNVWSRNYGLGLGVACDLPFPWWIGAKVLLPTGAFDSSYTEKGIDFVQRTTREFTGHIIVNDCEIGLAVPVPWFEWKIGVVGSYADLDRVREKLSNVLDADAMGVMDTINRTSELGPERTLLDIDAYTGLRKSIDGVGLDIGVYLAGSYQKWEVEVQHRDTTTTETATGFVCNLAAEKTWKISNRRFLDAVVARSGVAYVVGRSWKVKDLDQNGGGLTEDDATGQKSNKFGESGEPNWKVGMGMGFVLGRLTIDVQVNPSNLMAPYSLTATFDIGARRTSDKTEQTSVEDDPGSE